LIHIEDAIAQRTLIRTWLLRGTLHMVAADDLRWILALLSPTLVARYAVLARKAGLDEETVAKSYAAFTSALQGGNQLIRKELFAVLARAGIPLDAMQMAQLLNRAALEGLICLGSLQGKQTTYTLLDE
jgi:hypothetical protein